MDLSKKELITEGTYHMQLSNVSERYDFIPVLWKPRWSLEVPWNIWIAIGSCITTMLILYVTGNKGLIIAVPGVLFLFVLFSRPALGLFLTVVLYIPDQLYSAISGNDSSPGKYLPLFVLFACMKPFLAGWNSSPEVRRILGMFLFLVFWYFVTLIFSATMDSAAYCLQILLLFLFMFPATGLLGDRESLKTLCFAFVIMGSLGALIILSGYGLKYHGAGDRALYSTMSVNAISTNLGLCFIAGIIYWNIAGKTISRYLLIPLLILLYLGIIKTGTRSVIFGVPAAILLPFLIYSGRKFIKYWLAALIYITAVLFTFEFLSDNSIITGSLYNRITGGIGNNSKSDEIRMKLLLNGLQWYTENPLGCGPGSKNEIRVVFNGEREAHNTFISTLLQTGLIGLILLGLPLIYMFIASNSIKLRPYRISAIMAVTYFVMQLNKGSTLQTRIFWFQLLFTILLIKVGRQESAALKPNTFIVF